MTNDEVHFPNPVIAAQAAELPLVADPFEGHTMPAGQEFLGEHGPLSADDVVAEAKHSGKPVILNIGDSSTSGWDSDVVTRNRELRARNEPLLSAFFQYRTYSDLLRDVVGSDYLVVNAGVPAHTALQGGRRLKRLLDRLQRDGVEVHWVTAYYGNNDSVWDLSRQDKDWLGIDVDSFADSTGHAEQGIAVVTRSLPGDYRAALGHIVRTCREAGAVPVVIEPVTPLYWEPATRVRGENLVHHRQPTASPAYRLLDEARDLWSLGMGVEGRSDLRIAVLAEAREKDFVLPRIKRPHLVALAEIVEALEVPTVRVDLDRTEDDSRYFVDYCHPVGDANRMIADEIAAIVRAGRPEAGTARAAVPGSEEPPRLDPLPVDHYTLY